MNVFTIFIKIVATSWIVLILTLIPVHLYDGDIYEMAKDYGKPVSLIIGILFLISIAFALGGGTIALVLLIWR